MVIAIVGVRGIHKAVQVASVRTAENQHIEADAFVADKR
jgi:hypothetical protein